MHTLLTSGYHVSSGLIPSNVYTGMFHGFVPTLSAVQKGLHNFQTANNIIMSRNSLKMTLRLHT